MHDSIYGNGAGVTTVNVSGANGTATTTEYFVAGSVTAKGVFRNAHGSSTQTGTVNTKTLVFKLTVHGTE